MCNINGPQEGVYSINPKHMCVELPTNIDDNDLNDTTATKAKEMNEPTEMSYFIFRCMAGDYVRKIADAQPSMASGETKMDGKALIELEEDYRGFKVHLPDYFKLEKMDDPKVQAIHKHKPQLSMQRFIINLGIYLSKIRLHRPYLFWRTSTQPYASSRHACVEAARSLISVRRGMDNLESSYASSRTRIRFIVHHFFMAILVLALDLCFNEFPDDEAREAQRREVKDACKVLEGHDETGSPVASRLMVPLLDILRKHKISLQVPVQWPLRNEDIRNTADAGARNSGYAGIADPADAGEQQAGAAGLEAFSGFAGSGNMLWQDMLDLPNTFETTPDWDQLFADIDSTYSM